MDEIVLLVSRYIGTPVSTDICEVYQERALQKLQWIISREGDADGERTKPYYLAQLIAEAIRSDIMTAQCIQHYEDKKRAARKADNPQTQPHYSTVC